MPENDDLRLVAADMDGTLLDSDGRIPDAFWPLLARMRERGILFVPASGRQYATLRDMFDDVADGMPFIAENGTYVVRDEQPISVTPLDDAAVDAALAAVTAASDAGADVAAVVCGTRTAHVTRTDPAFLAEARLYYARRETALDLRHVDDTVIKVALFDFGDAETHLLPFLSDVARTHQVVVSGAHWIDVMAVGVDKGTALRALQTALGVTPRQTVAFGDYLNDIEMLRAAGRSYAMANAHPRVVDAARFAAPSNDDAGVVEVLTRLLG